MGLVSFRRFKEMLDEAATGWERTKPYDKYNDNDEAKYQSQSLKRGDFQHRIMFINNWNIFQIQIITEKPCNILK